MPSLHKNEGKKRIFILICLFLHKRRKYAQITKNDHLMLDVGNWAIGEKAMRMTLQSTFIYFFDF